jgi:CRISPR-associated endoribonuclease Cas6
LPEGRHSAIIHTFEIRFEVLSNDVPQPHWSFSLYRELEKRLSFNMAGLLGEEMAMSMSQYIEPLRTGEILWHVSCWDSELAYSIARIIHSMSSIVVYDKDKQIQIRLARYTSKELTDDGLASEFLLATDAVRLMGVRVITPALHKSEGKYLLFPSIDLIYYSILGRCQIFNDRFSLRDPSLINEIIKQTRIWQYELRTVPYEINGSNVVGYRGAFQVHFDGDDEVARLSGLILSLAKYTGIGLKTPEGMGACNIVF